MLKTDKLDMMYKTMCLQLIVSIYILQFISTRVSILVHISYGVLSVRLVCHVQVPIGV